MPFDPEAHRAEMLAHYTKLAKTPGWKQYVSHRLKEMAKECPGLYADLHELVAKALADSPAPSSSPTAAGPSQKPSA